MRSSIAALHAAAEAINLRRCDHFFRRRPRNGDVARHALLQEKFCRSYNRFGVKARAHSAVTNRVRDANHGHCLMMRHIGADDGELCSFRETRARKVDRLVPAVDAARAEVG
jgi:hypothetical protein